MKESYLVINGKKAELTEEQLKALGIEEKKENPFDVKHGENAYYISEDFKINDATYWKASDIGAYCPCKDEELVKARAKQEHLSRLLWRFAHENNSVFTTEEMNDVSTQKWYIGKELACVYKPLSCYGITLLGTQCFKTEEMCWRAIKEVVEPFINGKL